MLLILSFATLSFSSNICFGDQVSCDRYFLIYGIEGEKCKIKFQIFNIKDYSEELIDKEDVSTIILAVDTEINLEYTITRNKKEIKIIGLNRLATFVVNLNESSYEHLNMHYSGVNIRFKRNSTEIFNINSISLYNSTLIDLNINLKVNNFVFCLYSKISSTSNYIYVSISLEVDVNFIIPSHIKYYCKIVYMLPLNYQYIEVDTKSITFYEDYTGLSSTHFNTYDNITFNSYYRRLIPYNKNLIQNIYLAGIESLIHSYNKVHLIGNAMNIRFAGKFPYSNKSYIFFFENGTFIFNSSYVPFYCKQCSLNAIMEANNFLFPGISIKMIELEAHKNFEAQPIVVYCQNESKIEVKSRNINLIYQEPDRDFAQINNYMNTSSKKFISYVKDFCFGNIDECPTTCIHISNLSINNIMDSSEVKIYCQVSSCDINLTFPKATNITFIHLGATHCKAFVLNLKNVDKCEFNNFDVEYKFNDNNAKLARYKNCNLASIKSNIIKKIEADFTSLKSMDQSTTVQDLVIDSNEIINQYIQVNDTIIINNIQFNSIKSVKIYQSSIKNNFVFNIFHKTTPLTFVLESSLSIRIIGKYLSPIYNAYIVEGKGELTITATEGKNGILNNINWVVKSKEKKYYCATGPDNLNNCFSGANIISYQNLPDILYNEREAHVVNVSISTFYPIEFISKQLIGKEICFESVVGETNISIKDSDYLNLTFLNMTNINIKVNSADEIEFHTLYLRNSSILHSKMASASYYIDFNINFFAKEECSSIKLKDMILTRYSDYIPENDDIPNFNINQLYCTGDVSFTYDDTMEDQYLDFVISDDLNFTMYFTPLDLTISPTTSIIDEGYKISISAFSGPLIVNIWSLDVKTFVVSFFGEITFVPYGNVTIENFPKILEYQPNTYIKLKNNITLDSDYKISNAFMGKATLTIYGEDKFIKIANHAHLIITPEYSDIIIENLEDTENHDDFPFVLTIGPSGIATILIENLISSNNYSVLNLCPLFEVAPSKIYGSYSQIVDIPSTQKVVDVKINYISDLLIHGLCSQSNSLELILINENQRLFISYIAQSIAKMPLNICYGSHLCPENGIEEKKLFGVPDKIETINFIICETGRRLNLTINEPNLAINIYSSSTIIPVALNSVDINIKSVNFSNLEISTDGDWKICVTEFTTHGCIFPNISYDIKPGAKFESDASSFKMIKYEYPSEISLVNCDFYYFIFRANSIYLDFKYPIVSKNIKISYESMNHYSVDLYLDNNVREINTNVTFVGKIEYLAFSSENWLDVTKVNLKWEIYDADVIIQSVTSVAPIEIIGNGNVTYEYFADIVMTEYPSLPAEETLAYPTSTPNPTSSPRPTNGPNSKTLFCFGVENECPTESILISNILSSVILSHMGHSNSAELYIQSAYADINLNFEKEINLSFVHVGEEPAQLTITLLNNISYLSFNNFDITSSINFNNFIPSKYKKCKLTTTATQKWGEVEIDFYSINNMDGSTNISILIIDPDDKIYKFIYVSWSLNINDIIFNSIGKISLYQESIENGSTMKIFNPEGVIIFYTNSDLTINIVGTLIGFINNYGDGTLTLLVTDTTCKYCNKKINRVKRDIIVKKLCVGSSSDLGKCPDNLVPRTSDEVINLVDNDMLSDVLEIYIVGEETLKLSTAYICGKNISFISLKEEITDIILNKDQLVGLVLLNITNINLKINTKEDVKFNLLDLTNSTIESRYSISTEYYIKFDTKLLFGTPCPPIVLYLKTITKLNVSDFNYPNIYFNEKIKYSDIPVYGVLHIYVDDNEEIGLIGDKESDFNICDKNHVPFMHLAYSESDKTMSDILITGNKNTTIFVNSLLDDHRFCLSFSKYTYSTVKISGNMTFKQFPSKFILMDYAFIYPLIHTDLDHDLEIGTVLSDRVQVDMCWQYTSCFTFTDKSQIKLLNGNIDINISIASFNSSVEKRFPFELALDERGISTVNIDRLQRFKADLDTININPIFPIDNPPSRIPDIPKNTVFFIKQIYDKRKVNIKINFTSKHKFHGLWNNDDNCLNISSQFINYMQYNYKLIVNITKSNVDIFEKLMKVCVGNACGPGYVKLEVALIPYELKNMEILVTDDHRTIDFSFNYPHLALDLKSLKNRTLTMSNMNVTLAALSISDIYLVSLIDWYINVDGLVLVQKCLLPENIQFHFLKDNALRLSLYAFKIMKVESATAITIDDCDFKKVTFFNDYLVIDDLFKVRCNVELYYNYWNRFEIESGGKYADHNLDMLSLYGNISNVKFIGYNWNYYEGSQKVFYHNFGINVLISSMTTVAPIRLEGTGHVSYEFNASSSTPDPTPTASQTPYPTTYEIITTAPELTRSHFPTYVPSKPAISYIHSHSFVPIPTQSKIPTPSQTPSPPPTETPTPEPTPKIVIIQGERYDDGLHVEEIKAETGNIILIGGSEDNPENMIVNNIVIESGTKATALNLVLNEEITISGESSLKSDDGGKIDLAEDNKVIISIIAENSAIPTIDFGNIGSDFQKAPKELNISLDATQLNDQLIEKEFKKGKLLITAKTLNCELWLERTNISNIDDNELYDFSVECINSRLNDLPSRSLILKAAIHPKVNVLTPTKKNNIAVIVGAAVGVVCVVIVIIVVTIVILRRRNRRYESSSSISLNMDDNKVDVPQNIRQRNNNYNNVKPKDNKVEIKQSNNNKTMQLNNKEEYIVHDFMSKRQKEKIVEEPVIRNKNLLERIEQTNKVFERKDDRFLNDYIIDFSIYKKIKKLNQGVNTCVYLVEDEDYQKFAVKEITLNNIPKLGENFMREVNIMCEAQHPCVVKMYGFSLGDDTGKARIALEYLEKGSLDSLISSHGLTPTQKSIIVIGICFGMRYIHSLEIIHRDLKPANILLDKNFEAKIGDFGISRFYEGEDLEMTMNMGTPLYVAPEVFNSTTYNISSDVYSFGLIMLELVNEKPVYNKTIKPFELMRNKLNNNYGEISSKATPLAHSIIENCLSADGEFRPTFEQILNIIKKKDFGLFKGENNSLVAKYYSKIESCE